MQPLLAVLDLLLLVVSALAVVTGGPRAWAWALLIASGLWLPLNNTVLEGPTLVVLDATHGLTASDVAGVVGTVVAGLRLWPPTRQRSRAWLAGRAAVVVAVILAGFTAALVVTDERTDPAGPARATDTGQRSSFDIRRSASGLPPVWQVGQYWNDLS